MDTSTPPDRPGASTRFKRRRSRLIRHLGVAATALWCTLGTVMTAVVLSRFEPASSEAPASAIGRPLLPGSRLVATMLPLIRNVPDLAPVLVVLPEQADNLTENLVRQQLSHLAYPRRVTVEPWDVSTVERKRGGSDGQLQSYRYVVVVGTDLEAADWTPVASSGDVTLYRGRSR